MEAAIDEFFYFTLVPAAWLVLQLAALLMLRGGWRIAAWVSAAAMGIALAVAILGALAGSDLAPIWVVLALPLCLAWMLALWILRGVAWLLVAATARGFEGG